MKSLSCISLSRADDPLVKTNPPEIEEYKPESKSRSLVLQRPKIQTLVEVWRCELGRPPRSIAKDKDKSFGPSKHWTPLYYAVYHNRQAALVHFIRAGHAFDQSFETEPPPLCIAVAAGHLEIVKVLCEAGANVNEVTRHNGETALHRAVRQGHNDILEVLLGHGPNLEARTYDSRETPLHYAARQSGSLATVVALLRRGASYESLDSKGTTPAEIALQSQNLHTAVAIISAARGKRNKLVKEKEMLLKHVSKAARFSMSNDLIADIFEAGCDPDSTVLVEAIKRDDVGLVEMFLEKGVDPNRSTASGMLPIFAALNCSRAQVVRLLAKYGSDVSGRDADGKNVLQVALEGPCAQEKEAIYGIFDTLLTSGADAKVVYANGRTLLHRAVHPRFSLPRVAQRLLQSGAEVNKKDEAGNTALHLATHSKECVEVLLKHNADAYSTNNAGLTPLLYALSSASHSAEPDLNTLIKKSDLHKTDKRGKTALHHAAENGLENTIRSLLQSSTEATLVDNKNRTPLMLAVRNHQWSTVPLLATQPGINMWDENGKTPLHHIAMSIPTPPATWKAIASAAKPLCEQGISRSLRDRSGATPLIQAVKTLPEEGTLVIETLLSQTALAKGNCISHEDHNRRDALYYAAIMGKPAFVGALLNNGATFKFKTWKLGKGPLRADTAADKQTLKFFAEYEWLRRAILLQMQYSDPDMAPSLAKVLPVHDLSDMLKMGLNINALPNSTPASSLLWAILNFTSNPQPLPPHYLHDVMDLLLISGANPNEPSTRPAKFPSEASSSTPKSPQTLHPLTFLLEQHASIDLSLVSLFLRSGANLTLASTFYNGRHPLHSTVKANRLDIVHEFFLLPHNNKNRPNVNALDSRARTPLFIAAEKGFEDTALELLRRGAQVDIQDRDGATPLHAAIIGGSETIVSALLDRGAKVSRAVLDIAREKYPDEEGYRIKEDGIVGLLERKYSRDNDRLSYRTSGQQQLQHRPPKQPAVEEGKKKLREERESTVMMNGRKRGMGKKVGGMQCVVGALEEELVPVVDRKPINNSNNIDKALPRKPSPGAALSSAASQPVGGATRAESRSGWMNKS